MMKSPRIVGVDEQLIGFISNPFVPASLLFATTTWIEKTAWFVQTLPTLICAGRR
jgi:hypothetical protein